MKAKLRIHYQSENEPLWNICFSMNLLINSAHFFNKVSVYTSGIYMLQYIILKTEMVTWDTQLFCLQCFPYYHAMPSPPPTRKAAWLAGGSIPCARVTLSLLPARVLMQAEEQGSHPILSILHKHLGKPMEGHSTPPLQWHCQLETQTKHQNRINIWLQLHLGCVSYLPKHISNGTFKNL